MNFVNLSGKEKINEKLKTGMAEFMAKLQEEHDHHGIYIFWCYPLHIDDIAAAWILRFHD